MSACSCVSNGQAVAPGPRVAPKICPLSEVTACPRHWGLLSIPQQWEGACQGWCLLFQHSPMLLEQWDLWGSLQKGFISEQFPDLLHRSSPHGFEPHDGSGVLATGWKKWQSLLYCCWHGLVWFISTDKTQQVLLSACWVEYVLYCSITVTFSNLHNGVLSYSLVTITISSSI